MNPTTSNTLLTYSLSTAPDPLQASPEQGNTMYAALTFVISNSTTKEIDLSKLQFTFPAGKFAQELTNDPGAILWGTSPAGQWDIKMTSQGVFLALPKDNKPIPVTTDGIVIQFYNIAVNQQPGTVTITIDETANFVSQPPEVRKASFSIAKFPYGFFFENFTAQVPMVPDGQKVTLTWQGSDQATYEMYWGASHVPVTNVRTWTTPDPLTSDTTFLLRATVVYQGETITRDLSTTVIVANPELHATSIQVSGVADLQGNTTANTITVKNQFTANGTATFSKTLESTGGATFAGLTATQQLVASGGISTGQITAKSLTTTDDISVGGNTTLNGTTINGVVTMFKGPQQLSNSTKSYTVSTDGFVICYATTYQQGGSPNARYWGAIAVNYSLGLFAAGAANYNMNGGLTTGMAQLAVPIKKGTSFTIQPYTGSYGVPYFIVWWVPFGSAATIGSSIRDATPEEIASLPPLPPAEDFLATPEQQRDVFMDSLLEALQHASPEKKEAIANALGMREYKVS